MMRTSPRRPLILKRRKLTLPRNDVPSTSARDENSGQNENTPKQEVSQQDQHNSQPGDKMDCGLQKFPTGIKIIDHPTMPNTQVVAIPTDADIQSIIEALTAKGKECGNNGPNKFILISSGGTSHSAGPTPAQHLSSEKKPSTVTKAADGQERERNITQTSGLAGGIMLWHSRIDSVAGQEQESNRVFAHLEMLEMRAHEAAVKQQEKELQEEKLARLKARVMELRLQRDELQAKVDLQEKKQLEKEGATSGPAQASSKTVLQWKIKSLQAMLRVFYLTGISVKLTRQGVCFCISTAYEGTYLDSYYLDLLTKSEVQIYRHSVPPFIPLEQMAKQYLQTDIRRFLSVLSDHLNAYVGRRYQADQLQEHFSDHIKGALQRNSLCDLLVFNYNVSGKSKTFPFHVRLIYGDLCRSLPTEAIVSCTPDAPASLTETATAHSDLFRSMPLHKAFQSFSSAGGTQDGTP